jgi:predicted nucleic acid-binding protein
VSRTIVLDTDIFINAMNVEESHSQSSSALLDLVDAGEVKAVVSTITLAELAAGYYIKGDEKEWRELMLHILASRNYRVINLDASMADSAGRLKAETGLRLPDAIVASSGLGEGAEYVVTLDEGFRKASIHIGSLTPTAFLETVK